MNRRTAFSIVELLVVITIIVVLLALLAPALDKAVYEAELVACGARLDAGASAVLTYAADFKRHYPHRPGVQSEGGWKPNQFKSGGVDHRDSLKAYMSINATLNCPLTATVDIEKPRDPYSLVFSPLAMWYGWRYWFPGVADQGMLRLGDRFTWTTTSSQGTTTARFSLLLSDMNEYSPLVKAAIVSHPDRDRILTSYAWRDEPYGGLDVVTGVKYTDSRWEGPQPSALDLNFAFDDGSVEQVRDAMPQDPRLTPVPLLNNSTYDQWSHYMVEW